jgi:hypothetical protein
MWNDWTLDSLDRTFTFQTSRYMKGRFPAIAVSDAKLGCIVGKHDQWT